MASSNTPGADTLAPFVRFGPPVDAPTLLDVRRLLAARPLSGKSQLAGTFAASRGFGLTFRRDTLPLARERMPFIGHLTDALPPFSPFAPLAERPLNAFYANVLTLSDAAAVGPHIDGTLSDLSPACAGATPDVVSVLYIDVEGRCGDLQLAYQGTRIARVPPVAGQVVHFRGDLTHEVLPGDAGAHRRSLVLEQYAFTPEQLAATPDLRAHSQAPAAFFSPPHSGAHAPFSDALARKRKTGGAVPTSSE